MPTGTSESLRHFGWSDFDPGRLDKKWPRCPVRGCSADLEPVPYGSRKKPDGTLPWCPEHRIRLHSKTFVYWNARNQGEDARLRNFIVRHDLSRKVALRKGMKVEGHRLGFEMSEDALSWNVFVSLAEAGKLRAVVKFLTGRELHGTPNLYLWGRRIDSADGKHEQYEPLRRVRAQLEDKIHIPTEPDIMLVAEGELLVCIEAKFGSANPVSRETAPKDGEKPTSRAGLLDRYLGDHASGRTKATICREKIPEALCIQLFRNIVFASEMADVMPWHVVNLVKGDNSCTDPSDEVCGYLHADWRHCFTFRTWESLHAAVISGDPQLDELDRYLRNKSAHFQRAFPLLGAT